MPWPQRSSLPPSGTATSTQLLKHNGDWDSTLTPTYRPHTTSMSFDLQNRMALGLQLSISFHSFFGVWDSEQVEKL